MNAATPEYTEIFSHNAQRLLLPAYVRALSCSRALQKEGCRTRMLGCLKEANPTCHINCLYISLEVERTAEPETTVRACVSTFVSVTPLDVFNRMIPDVASRCFCCDFRIMWRQQWVLLVKTSFPKCFFFNHKHSVIKIRLKIEPEVI